jgi:subtilisin family serine protease
MKRYPVIFILTAFVIIAGCSKNNETNSAPAHSANNPDLLTTAQINSIIRQQLEQKGSFDWKDVSDEVIWSALKQSDHILSVGYKPSDEINVEDRLTQINIKESKWKSAKQQVLQIIYNSENNASSLKATQQEVWKENVLPVADVYVTNINTIKLLRASNLVRYAEPMGYDPGTYEKDFNKQPGPLTSSNSSGSGCGGYDGDASLVNGVDYTVTSPNAEVSWNYSYQHIQDAWAKSTGQGVTVMIIDTGVSPDQDNLGSGFNRGYSSGRTIEKMVTLPGGTIDDVCGHGTAMAGECGAPRGTVGASCGVAYNCNLITCHAAEDVYLDESKEVKGVSDAFTSAGNNDTVKIVSMSMGRITNSSQMADAIKYAYGKGKLIFCAGGTSFSWVASWWGVIFPATMSQVEAITGVQDNLSNVENCTDCHQGKQIDFVIVMERVSDGQHPITLATSGNVPTTVGGSSVSTSTAAGIAALVWSKYPSYTSAQIITKLQQSSSYYPKKNANFGSGIINADLATN